MLDSTSAYKTAIKASQRYTDAIVVVSFAKEIPLPDTDPIEYESPFGTTYASSSLSGFSFTQLSNGRIRVNSAQYNGATTQGGNTIPAHLQLPTEVKTPSTGWKSTEKSDEDGVMSASPTIGVTYDGVLASAVWIVGTSANYPVDFSVSINGSVTNITGNTREIYVHKFTEIVVEAVEIVIDKISEPLANAHVIEIGVPSRVYFDRNDIIEIGGIEEMSSDTGSYIGNVSSNEAYVKFNNTSGIFSISGDYSPLEGIISAEVEFKPFIGVEISENVIEMIAMGSFTSSDWPVTLGIDEFNLQGFDYMETLRKIDMPYISTSNNPTNLVLSEYINKVGEAANLTFDFNTYHDTDLVLAYSPRSTIKEFLQDVTAAIPGTCYISRLKEIKIREFPFDDNVSRNPVMSSWLDTNIVINSTNPQKFSDTYSNLIIKVPNISPLYNVEVCNIKDIVFTNSITLSNIKFIQPIYYIETIEIRGASQVSIESLKYSSTKCQIELSSTALTSQKVEIIIKACVINIKSTDYECINPVVNGKYNLSKEIETTYLQSNEACEIFAEEYFLALGNPTSNFEIETYWDMSIELGDRISVLNITDGMSVDISVKRQTWTWDGALSAVVEGRKLFTR